MKSQDTDKEPLQRDKHAGRRGRGEPDKQSVDLRDGTARRTSALLHALGVAGDKTCARTSGVRTRPLTGRNRCIIYSQGNGTTSALSIPDTRAGHQSHRAPTLLAHPCLSLLRKLKSQVDSWPCHGLQSQLFLFWRHGEVKEEVKVIASESLAQF